MIQASPLLESYIPSLKRVIFDKLILKLSKIYTSLSISFFTTSLCPESFIPWGEAEIIIVQLVHQGVVQLHLDYSRRAILFGSISSSPDSMSVLSHILRSHISIFLCRSVSAIAWFKSLAFFLIWSRR